MGMLYLRTESFRRGDHAGKAEPAILGRFGGEKERGFSSYLLSSEIVNYYFAWFDLTMLAGTQSITGYQINTPCQAPVADSAPPSQQSARE